MQNDYRNNGGDCKQMKVLQVNCVYNKGSTGKIMYDVHTELLKNQIDSVICYGRGEKTTDKNVYKTCGELYSKFNNFMTRITGLMYGGLFFSTNKLISIIKKEKPDVVHLQCINGYFVNIYRLISWLKKSKIKTVVTLHAEFMHTANCGHAFECEKWKSGCGKCPRLKKETGSILLDRTKTSFKKMKKAFEGFENMIVTSVSPWLMNRAKESPILADKKHVVVMNGLDTSIFHRYDTSELRKELGVENKTVIFHATASFTDIPNDNKGGHYIIELAKLMPEIQFFVASNQTIVNEEIPNNIKLLGRLANQTELAKYYSMADLTVIASKRETFSMITAESLCCGTPVVGFKAGGPETIGIDEYSIFVEHGNIDKLIQEAKQMIFKEIDNEEISQTACKKYSKQEMCKAFISIYNNFTVREGEQC